MIIIILFIFFKYFWHIGSKIILLFLIVNIVECFILIKKFHSHTFFIKKNNIEYNQKIAKNFCKKHNKTSLNIVGNVDQRKYLAKIYPKEFRDNIPLTSNSCKVFFHHERKDVVKKGLGYNQSSLTTKKMINLSEYQDAYQKKQGLDFSQNERKYISSFVKYFVNSKTMYVNKTDNSIRDDLYEFENSYIKNFIINYDFDESVSIFNKTRKYFQPLIIKILNNSNFSDFFPKISRHEIKNLKFKNFIFLPLWQSSDYYYNYKNKFYKLKKFSFGHQISNNLNNFEIYYIPISFILGVLSFCLGLFIILITTLHFIIFKNLKKNN